MGLPAEFPNFPECDASAAVTVNVGTDQPELNLGAVVGNRCSVGTLSLTSLQKKNGRLVYP
jgi:hypothetical protein